MSASERGEAAPPPRITLRALLLGTLTIVVVFYTLEYIGQSAKVGGFVKIRQHVSGMALVR